MNSHARTIALSATLLSATALGAAAMNPTVGGAPMYESRNIVENAVNSPDHTTLVAAVTAAGLADVLMGEGPFTVFAPVNSGFDALPAGTVDTLLMPENREMLTKVLTAHVVSGDLTAAELASRMDAGGGRAVLRTVSGDALAVETRGGNTYVIDENGNGSRITVADVMQSNGVIHVVEAVLVPK